MSKKEAENSQISWRYQEVIDVKKIKFGNCFSVELPDSFIVVNSLRPGYHPGDPDGNRTLIIDGEKQGMFSVEKYADLDGKFFETRNYQYSAENIGAFIERIAALEELFNKVKCEAGGSGRWHWCIRKLYEDGQLRYTEYRLACEGCPEMISVLQTGEEDCFSELLPYIKVC